MARHSFTRVLMLLLSLAWSPHSAWADASGSAGMAQASQVVSAGTSIAFSATMMPTCTGGTAKAAMACTAAGLGIVGGLLGMAMAFMNGGKKNELTGDGFTDMPDFNFDDQNFRLNDVINDPTACSGANANPIICAPGGFKANTNKIIADLKGAIRDGKIKGSDADKLNGLLSAAESGDVGKMTAALNANKDVAAASGFSDAEPIAKVGEAPSTGVSSNVAFSGEEATSEIDPNGGGKGNAHIDGSLGSVDWNGLLDMLDSKTGKSLTLWQRATRRYQGGPSGKRAVMLARMEIIRKTAIAKMKSQKGTSTVAIRDFTKESGSDKKPAGMAPKN